MYGITVGNFITEKQVILHYSLSCLQMLIVWNVNRFYTVSQKTSHLWLAITLTRERILIFFGRNVTDKVSNQKTLYYATSNNLCFCTTWWNGETRKLHFRSNAVLVHEFNQLLDFFNLFDSTHTLLYDSLSLVISAFSYRTVGRHGSRDSAAAAGCAARTLHQCTAFWVSYFAM